MKNSIARVFFTKWGQRWPLFVSNDFNAGPKLEFTEMNETLIPRDHPTSNQSKLGTLIIFYFKGSGT